jgi:hypothetical protein
MTTTSHQIADNLFLVRQVLPRSGPPPKPAVPPPTNHIAIVDCSGSMYGELDRVKQQLKNKLAGLIGPKDTVTLIWFSGRGQCGLVIEAEPVASLPDLAAVHKAIDKWLHPVGLTGFKEPIELAVKTAQKLAGKGACSLFFMSDGCDNQWSRPEILKAVGEVAAVCASSAFVEYGYYADRPLLAAMAEKAGGSHVHCEDFQRYEPTFAAVLGKQVIGGKRIEVAIEGDPILGFAYAGNGGDLLTFGVEFNKIAVPEDITEVCYLSPRHVGVTGETLGRVASGSGSPQTPTLAAAYGALSLLAVRMKPEIIYPILRALGDVHFIERFAACFGKQQYSAFMDDARGAVFDTAARMVKGYDPTKVPDDNAFTVLQLLELLTGDDEARVLFDHPAWTYARIGRQRIDANDMLDPADQAKVDELTAKLATIKAVSKRKEIQTEIDAILAKKQDALTFTADPAPDGYPIANLTLNEERPNVSILVRKEGAVDLSKRIAATTGIKGLDKLPAPFPTWIFRNYTIIKDGLVNVDKMPVRLSRATYDKLVAAGVRTTEYTQHADKPDVVLAVLDLRPLPTINRSMVKTASARKLFELEWELTQVRARQKVYNTVAKDTAGPKVSRGYGVVYGAEAAEWLKEQGLTDFNGFSPKVVQAPPSGDFYMAKKLEVGLKGFATLPSVKDVRAKMGNGKGKAPTGCTALMIPTINEVDTFLTTNAKAPEHVRTGYLEGMQKATTAQTRALLFQKAQRLFTIIVGQVWFEEFPTLDDKTLTLKLAAPGLDGPQDVLCTAELTEEKIEL